MCNQALKHFRTLTGEARRTACRAHLAQSHAINFAANDPHALTVSQQAACAEMAKAVSWRKSPASPLAVGMAFYVYLARDTKPVAQDAAPSVAYRAPRRAFVYSSKGH